MGPVRIPIWGSSTSFTCSGAGAPEQQHVLGFRAFPERASPRRRASAVPARPTRRRRSRRSAHRRSSSAYIGRPHRRIADHDRGDRVRSEPRAKQSRRRTDSRRASAARLPGWSESCDESRSRRHRVRGGEARGSRTGAAGARRSRTCQHTAARSGCRRRCRRARPRRAGERPARRPPPSHRRRASDRRARPRRSTRWENSRAAAPRAMLRATHVPSVSVVRDETL